MSQILHKLVDQFRQIHSGNLPKEIVVAPAALAALSIKQGVKLSVYGTQVTCRLFDKSEVTKLGTGTKLGVFVKKDKETSLRSCDLA